MNIEKREVVNNFTSYEIVITIESKTDEAELFQEAINISKLIYEDERSNRYFRIKEICPIFKSIIKKITSK